MPTRVYFPLRSNASALVAGLGVESVRRRLKLCSLLYDEVFIETGQRSIQAGPNGSFDGSRQTERWQTSHERSVAQKGGFQISMAVESTPGVPAAGPYTPIVNSKASISWEPTLTPFLAELPPSSDWVQPVVVGDPPEQIKASVEEWSKRDSGNGVLDEAQPERYVRELLIKHTNGDLGDAMANGVALSTDVIHRAVIAARIDESANWHMTGFAMPVLFPLAATQDWVSIARLRIAPEIDAYRQILREVEESALDLAKSGGDIERAVHRTYEARLRAANDKLESLGAVMGKTVAWLCVGVGAGFATAPLTGPFGPVVGATPALASGAMEIGRVIGSRRRRAWLSVDASLANWGKSKP